MANAVVDEIFWEFGQRLVSDRVGRLLNRSNRIERLSKRIYSPHRIVPSLPSAHFIVGWTGNLQLEELWPEVPKADDRSAWYSNCAWLLAKLEVAASAGCIPETPEDKVLDVVTTLAGDAGRASAYPSWRLGLAKDYVSRIGAQGSERAPGSERLVHVMSEYMALVDEFRASEAGRVFLGWAIRSAAPADHRARLFAQRLEKEGDDHASLVLEGASEFRRLIANCHARLRQMDNSPSLRSACWCFHGNLFQQRRAFDMACAIQALRLNLLELGDVQDEEAPSIADDPAELVEHLREISSQQEELTTLCSDLADSDRWASNRAKSSWREVLSPVPVPRY